MLDKRFQNYISSQQRRQFLQLFKQKFNNKEYLLFLRKFRGSMISKGNRSISYKLYDSIRMFLKKAFKGKTEKYVDIDGVFKFAISNLIPVLGVSNVKRGRKIVTIPILLKLRKRIVLMNKWLISNQKNKSNVRGIKINEVSRLILHSIFNKGNIYEQKIENLKRAYVARHILLKMSGKKTNKRAFKHLQKQVIDSLEKKYEILEDVDKKSKRESLIDSFEKLFDVFLFLKYKKKYRRIKSIIKDLRFSLVATWKNGLPLKRRWIKVWNWLDYLSEPSKKLKFKNKELALLKKKYKKVWQEEARKIE